MSDQAVYVRNDPRRVVTGEYEPGTPGPGEVLVQTHSVGICHSDVALLNGDLDDWFQIDYPVVFGHEWSGDVVELGQGVAQQMLGKRVSACGALGGNRWMGLTDDGGACDRFTVPADLLYEIPPQASYDQGALIEPFACVYRGVRRIGGTDASDQVVVIGGGTIGQYSVALCAELGARTVLIEPSPSRRELAQRLGAEATLDPIGIEDLGAAVSELTSGGATLVIEAAGVGPALASAFDVPRFGARLLMLGLCPDKLIPAAISQIQEKDLLVRASMGAPAEIWEPAIAFLGRSELDLTAIVTSRYPLDDAPEAFEAAVNTASNVKVLLDGEAAL